MSSRETEQKINQNIEKASKNAQEEVVRLRAELDELRRKTQPRVEKVESYLTSPTAIGFYQGFIVGVAAVLGYAKYNNGLRI
ncbi:hypothetical protein BX666DRAFT_1957440 [Dichotomocladium elegans]|nr:hypothetical protein BX666DRAFT_1957440 [Dichotomocladium elegans]